VPDPAIPLMLYPSFVFALTIFNLSRVAAFTLQCVPGTFFIRAIFTFASAVSF